MKKSPGRPKGTKVVLCACGRRVVGQPGKQAVCQGCFEPVLIKPAATQTKTKPFLLPAPKRKAKRK